MTFSAVEIIVPYAINVSVTDDTLTVELSGSRTISVPIEEYPRLTYGSCKERNNSNLIGRGEGIHRPDLDEHISVKGLLTGKPSGESQESFKKWLAHRKTHIT